MNISKIEIKNFNTLPFLPGIYKFFDQKGKLIYIGKAKNIKKRVNSYFNRELENNKTRILVSCIRQVEWIIVNNENEALLLENNLIKEYKPKYNILLKDDKTFPWIAIKKESFPRIFYTRRLVNDGTEYFGPYTSKGLMNMILELIKKLYKIRTCSYKLTLENIKKKKFNTCLEYHIKNCNAPCIGLEYEEEYIKSIAQIREILRGNTNRVRQLLEKQKSEFVKKQNFEKAHLIKIRISMLDKHIGKTIIVNPIYKNIDTFSIYSDNKKAYINFIKVVKGSIIQSMNLEVTKKMDEQDDHILLHGILNIRQKLQSFAREVIVPFMLPENIEGVAFIVPKRGDKRKMLDLSEKNLKQYYFQKKKAALVSLKINDIKQSLEFLKLKLGLKQIPVHIECFDNSNLQGTNPVAACVVFKNGKPSKKDYRHFNIKTVVGPDDFASMEEVIYRRYFRLLNEKKPLPHLIVVDGGKGQLTAAANALRKLELLDKVDLIALAKKLEEIFILERATSIILDRKTRPLKILQQIRNEAHRFGINHHRKKRINTTLKSELEKIDGIGKLTASRLLKKYGSVKEIKKQNLDTLDEDLNKKQLIQIQQYFKL